ncbi:MAG: nucleotide-binding protein [Myxococcales bacterium]|nr:nucleotide-binding protein [Myxococcales bacterium]
MRIPGRIAWLLLCCAPLGCDDETAANVDATQGATDGGLDAMGPQCDVSALFKQRCGTPVCHEGSTPAARLDLIASGVEDRVSLAVAAQCPGTLADPSDPTQSVLYTKIAGVPECGARMPLGQMPLSEDEVRCVRDWISGLLPPPPPPVGDLGVPPDRGPPPPPRDMAPPEMVCTPGETEACYSGPDHTRGVAPCAPGMRTCAPDGASFGPCQGQVLPSVEDCRTPEVDEDCNGSTPACGQTWSLAFGDGGAQSARSVAIDSAGNVFMLGDFENTIGVGGDPLVADGTKADIVLAKYDRFGNPMWSKRYGDSSNQYATQVMVDADDNIYLLGRAFGTITFGGPVHDGVGTDDIFVAKLDNNGDYLWSRMFGGLDPDRAERMAVDGNGDLLVTGTFSGVADFGGGPFATAGLRDAFLLKLNGQNGAHIFSKQIGGPGDDYGFGVGVGAEGQILLTGRFEETIHIGDNELVSAGLRDIFVAAFDNFGFLQWARRYGGDGDDFPFDLVASPATGEFAITGYLSGVVDFGDQQVRSAGSLDYFIAAFNADGSVRWAQRYGDETNQFDTDFDTNTWSALATDPDNNLYLTGPLSGIARFGDGPPLNSAGRTDIFIVKLDRDGAWLFGNRFGTDNSEIGLDVAVGPDGQIAVAGRIFGTRGVDFGAAGRVESQGSSDGFVLQVEP